MRAVSPSGYTRNSSRKAGRAEHRHDPAPSRWSWRMQRLMLTPMFRLTVWVFLPLAVVAGGTQLWLSNPANRDVITGTVDGWIDDFQDRPQFMVNLIQVDGAGVATEEKIREIVDLDLPLSSFDIDLPALRDKIAELPGVADVALQVRSGGTLQIAVMERIPVAVWSGPAGDEMIDPTGTVTGTLATRLDRPDLPLLAGEGADRAVPEAMAILKAAAPLEERLRGLQRIGERRWDLVLDRGQRIMLPEDQPVQALERVLALQRAQELLDRDVVAVDMRLGVRPTLRMTEAATEEWQHMRDVAMQAKGQ